MWSAVRSIFVVFVCFKFFIVRSESNLEFLQEPISRLVKLSEGRGVFRCVAAPPGAEIHWLYKGGPLPHNRWIKASGGRLTLLFGKMSNSTRTAHFLEYLRDAYFQCEIRFRGKALVSPPAKLIVAVLDDFPPLNINLNINAVPGNTAVIPCDPPHGVPTVVTEFLFNNEVIDRSIGNKHIMPSGDLQIFNAKPEDSGEYICIAHNPFLAVKVKSKRKVILHVKETFEEIAATFIKTPQSTVSAALGRNLTLECVAVGNPKPTITWKRKEKDISDNRHQQQGGNLRIINVSKEDEGAYVCEAEDVFGNKVVQSTNILIQETPQILKPPSDRIVELGSNFSLSCPNRGQPKPSIKWFHNGKELVEARSKRSSLISFHNVNQKHGGIYQCLVSNNIGTSIASVIVTITPGNSTVDFDEDDDYEDSDERGFGIDDYDFDDGTRGAYNPDTGKRHHKRKHSKEVKLIPPSKPDINRLSNTSVMVRWTVGNGGLTINFFKLQYKEVGKKKSNWMTLDEDIDPHIHSFSVTNLKTGGAYRFRIVAVYSNTDNRDGPISDKFVLVKDTPMEKPTVIPIIIFAEAASPSAITLRWEYQEIDSIQTDGFFIYYRETHMAGKYLKVSVLGANTRSHIISHLLPDNGYDIKMQSFNHAGTSDFSNIYTAKTLKSKESEVTATTRNKNKAYYDEVPSITESVSSKSSDSNLIYIISGIFIGISILVVCVCVVRSCRQKQSRPENSDDSDSREEPLKVGNGHVTSNGYISAGNKINININPLSHLDLENSEKTDDLGTIVSNNNQIIRLQTFNLSNGLQEEPLLNDIERELNNRNSEIDKITSVISNGSVENPVESPAEV